MPRILMANRNERTLPWFYYKHYVYKLCLVVIDFDREIMTEMGQLGILGPTIKGVCV